MVSAFYYLFFLSFLELTSLPVMIVVMILLSMTLFFSFWISCGSCWLPMLFMLLFVGGILVVFMVVSSLFPNSSNTLFSFSIFPLLFLFLFSFGLLFPLSSNSSPVSMKFYIYSLGNFYSLTFLVLCYFFSFLYFVSKDKISLRSFF